MWIPFRNLRWWSSREELHREIERLKGRIEELERAVGQQHGVIGDQQADVRKALTFLKIAKYSPSWVEFNALLSSQVFDHDVITHLEQACGWSEEDEQEARRQATAFHTETQGKSLEERRSRMRRILSFAGKTAGAAGVLGIIARYFRNRRNRKNDEGSEH